MPARRPSAAAACRGRARRPRSARPALEWSPATMCARGCNPMTLGSNPEESRPPRQHTGAGSMGGGHLEEVDSLLLAEAQVLPQPGGGAAELVVQTQDEERVERVDLGWGGAKRATVARAGGSTTGYHCRTAWLRRSSGVRGAEQARSRSPASHRVPQGAAGVSCATTATTGTAFATSRSTMVSAMR